MNRIFVFLLSACLVFLYSSCSDSGDCGCDPPNLRAITATEQNIIESSNNFSFDIFARINEADPDKNLFISPLSISTALSMTANGAVGETKDGIKATLHQGDLTDEEINGAYQSLAEYLTNVDPKVIMQLANSNWYKDDYHIKEAFKNILLEYYDAEVKSANFANPDTKDLINDWIENKTNGKITDMLDAIPSDAVMYLINAIYLKATWRYKFDKSKTEKQNFYLSDGSIVETDMMYSEGATANIRYQPDYTFIELPYGNGQFNFSIILPTELNKLDQIIDAFDVDQLNQLTEAANSLTAEIYLPKFKTEYKITLNEVLSAMGMAQSFGGSADFSQLFEEQLDLCISRVLHQSFIEVDEEGTEAAAATVVEIVETSAGGTPKIIINQPFLYFIREKHSNTILFAGKLLDPTKS